MVIGYLDATDTRHLRGTPVNATAAISLAQAAQTIALISIAFN